MAAFEIGCELDTLVPLVDAGKDAKNSIESTGEAMDRLLSRLNKEIDEKPVAVPTQNAARKKVTTVSSAPSTGSFNAAM